MSGHDDGDGAGGANGPPTPPGVNIEHVGPLGLPFPTPDLDAAMEVGLVGDPEVNEMQDESNPLDEAMQYGEGYIDAVEDAIENEDCAFCEGVLKDLRGEPPSVQMKGLRELKELKELMDRDEMPDEEEIAALLDTFDVVEMPGVGD
jgi:hypothetical protein